MYASLHPSSLIIGITGITGSTCRQARRRRALSWQHRTRPDRRNGDAVALPVFFDAMDLILAIAQIFYVRHQIREARFRDECEPLALRRFVGRFGAAAEIRDLGPRRHRQ